MLSIPDSLNNFYYTRYVNCEIYGADDNCTVRN